MKVFSSPKRNSTFARFLLFLIEEVGYNIKILFALAANALIDIAGSMNFSRCRQLFSTQLQTVAVANKLARDTFMSKLVRLAVFANILVATFNVNNDY